ncbi:carboxylate--amine ligase [Pseudokineococcus sp. 1T1Z-3]|uniref:carboxylate--amine ligase n=1 Tax=Pseudokineococcus sp. 1T1Z-3 TaxID=3132745 RepID=UPI0030A08545
MRRPPPPAPPAPPVQPVVLGGDIGAYSLARAAHEAYGVRSTLVSAVAAGPVAHSRAVEHVAQEGMKDPQVAVAALRRVADDHEARGSGPLLLLGSTDGDVRLLVEHREQLEDRFLLPYVGRELLDRMTAKESFGAVCAELGIPTPRTVVVDVQKEARAAGGPGVDVGRTVDGGPPITFPAIAKTASTVAYATVSFPGKLKVFTVRDQAELDDLMDVLARAGYDGSFLVQDLVPGDDAGMRVLTCYCDTGSRVRFAAHGHVLLEEHTPGTLGNPAAILTGAGPEAAEATEQATRLLEHVGWTGYANFDLKMDPRTGRAVFFELNPRLGRTNHYVTAAGQNPLELYVRELVQGLDPLPPGAPALAAEERLFTVLPPQLLLRYVGDPELRERVRGLVKAGHVADPLRYGPDRDPRRWAYRAAYQLNQVRKYRTHYPLEQARSARAQAEALVRGTGA